ncbi:MAG: excinuclease ABC subunit UvrC, partial [Clostridiales bacterium]|nr:excinuclease ABC subunit UvrC [Candidatus Apopatousia equi]
LKEKLLSLPTCSGCYIMKDKDDNVIYVGKAKNLKRRVNSYFNRTQKNLKTENLVKNIKDFDYIITNTEYDCLILENNLIKKYQPHYNILLKDDKNFPYIKVNLKDDYPIFEITRKIKQDGSKYFGPYFAGVNVYEILNITNFAFGLKTCKQSINENKFLKNACINYAMGLCSAPCINNVSKEEYKQKVLKAVDFLNGDYTYIQNILEQKMNSASEKLNFETAIKIREQLNSLKRLKERYLTQFTTNSNFDVINGYFDGLNACLSVVIIRNGKMLGVENFNLISLDEKPEIISSFITQYYNFDRLLPHQIFVDVELSNKNQLEEYLTNNSGHKIEIKTAKIGDKLKLCKLAENNAKEYLQKSLSKEQTKQNRTIGACKRLQSLLNLSKTPLRMECYDISHISGTNKVASMVVFENGEPAKNMYRKFNIKAVEGNNDFACLNETLERRLNELTGKDVSFSKLPDLIIIDGGKGQLSATYPLLEKFNLKIDMISLAEREEEIYVPNNSLPIVLKRNDLALQLVQRIRDEAHRFAITFHRQKRAKTMILSELDNIKGLGLSRKKALIKKFGSVKNIKKATLEELSKTPSLPQNLAQIIFDYFKK